MLIGIIVWLSLTGIASAAHPKGLPVCWAEVENCLMAKTGYGIEDTESFTSSCCPILEEQIHYYVDCFCSLEKYYLSLPSLLSAATVSARLENSVNHFISDCGIANTYHGLCKDDLVPRRALTTYYYYTPRSSDNGSGVIIAVVVIAVVLIVGGIIACVICCRKNQIQYPNNVNAVASNGHPTVHPTVPNNLNANNGIPPVTPSPVPTKPPPPPSNYGAVPGYPITPNSSANGGIPPATPTPNPTRPSSSSNNGLHFRPQTRPRPGVNVVVRPTVEHTITTTPPPITDTYDPMEDEYVGNSLATTQHTDDNYDPNEDTANEPMEDVQYPDYGTSVPAETNYDYSVPEDPQSRDFTIPETGMDYPVADEPQAFDFTVPEMDSGGLMEAVNQMSFDFPVISPMNTLLGFMPSGDIDFGQLASDMYDS